MSSPADKFLARPHRTTALLSVPVFFGLVAEPVAALVDTAFVKELGEIPVAALGTGTLVLSSVFWIFNFIGISTQTEVARAFGGGDRERARGFVSLALAHSIGFGLALTTLLWLVASPVCAWMQVPEAAHAAAVDYVRLRALGAPFVLTMLAGAGALRGLQRMNWPMALAILTNALNVLFDWILIFGAGPIPPLGIEGAALATTIAQGIGAALTFVITARIVGLTGRVPWHESRNLLVIGFDLFVRTGLLTAFLVIATRTSNSIAIGAAAANHGIRTVWMFTALALDAYAATAQSLIGYFVGADRRPAMRRVASIAIQQSFAFAFLLAGAMIVGTNATARHFVPEEAHEYFRSAWIVAALGQPLNAIAFATDGIHWGTSDYRYLRNAMIWSSAIGVIGLLWIEPGGPDALAWVWGVTTAWVAIRSVFGVLRIWPGSGPWATSGASLRGPS